MVRRAVQQWRGGITIGQGRWTPKGDAQICVVGAGKAGVGMARGLVDGLSTELLERTSGWINVPEDCLAGTAFESADLPASIHLHPARPAGINEPTAEGVTGTNEILSRVNRLRERDLCVVLLSGGGSALLPAPIEGITLDDKLQVTRLMMQSGAPIQDLNLVRRALSRIKGGGLLRTCRAGSMITLVISDVIGDPPEIIASGPTVEETRQPACALELLDQYAKKSGLDVPSRVREVLREQERELSGQGGSAAASLSRGAEIPSAPHNARCRSFLKIIGNNLTAVAAAAACARELGFTIQLAEADRGGVASELGSEFADRISDFAGSTQRGQRAAWISGGEPVVHLVQTDQPRKGGRNQELVLAAAQRLIERFPAGIPENCRFALCSGGTDGEDGPTDAAGAVIDRELIETIRRSGASPKDFLSINNAYPFFEQFGGLLKTGPTHTNVMDLRIGLLNSSGAR